MILFVLKRLGNQQFKALKSITHPNQQLIQVFIRIFSKIFPLKLLPQKTHFQNCSLEKYIFEIAPSENTF